MHLAGAGSGAASGNVAPTLSVANFTWYFWSTLNSQLFAPLFILALGGTVWTTVALVRRGDFAGDPRLEFLVGGVVAWLAITLTPHHDIRYDMPLLPYLAVIGTGWIVHLPRLPRLAATGTLALAVTANTLATTFGVGGLSAIKLVKSPPATEAFPDQIVFYSNRGFLVAGPQRDGNVPGLFQALRRDGVELIAFDLKQSQGPDFSFEGLLALALIAKVSLYPEPSLAKRSPTVAALIHQPISPGAPATCARLSDGTGVWVVRLNPASGKLAYYCPLRRSHYYGYYSS